MKSIRKIFIAFTMLYVSMHPVVAQKIKQPDSLQRYSIKLLAKGYEDSVVLRWAPSHHIAWDYLNNNGYSIWRLEVSADSSKKPILLTPVPLKPLTLQEMKNRLGRDNQMAAIAAQSLYGTTFTPSKRGGFAGTIADQGDLFKNRYVFSLLAADYDAPTAEAIALRYVDKSVKKGTSYMYKILPAIPARNVAIDSGVVLVINTKQEAFDGPSGLAGIAMDRQAEIHWNRYNKEQYSGYYIERSEDGKNFKQLTKMPYFSSLPDSAANNDTLMARFRDLLKTQQMFVDSLPGNYKTYYYRIRGINAFSELSAYSETINVMGRDMTPPAAPSLLTPELLGGRKVKVTWMKADKEADLTGYVINKSKEVNGKYELVTSSVLPATQMSFVDTAAYEHGGTFYVVAAIDTAGNYGVSLPVMAVLPDSTAPLPPTGLKGRIDKKGIVHLSWNQNKEEDLRTYKVYFANNPSHTFAMLTIADLQDTAFVDSITLETLTKNIYYRVVAVDYNNNHSSFSEILKLKKPDVVPPVPPVFRNIQVNNSGVNIGVIQSSSEDAARYTIFRKQEGQDWRPVSFISHDTSKIDFVFKDTTIVPGFRYFYSAEAVDEDSLHSEMSAAYPVKISSVAEQNAINTLKGSYDNKVKLVKLNWEYTNAGDYFFVLYRATGNGPLVTYRSFDKEVQSFTDGDLGDKVGSYRYAIKAIFKDGRPETRLSSELNLPIVE